MTTMRIKPGHGYWATDHYPIGGAFRRAGDSGKVIAEILRDIQPPCRGCDIEVKFADGSRGALARANTQGVL